MLHPTSGAENSEGGVLRGRRNCYFFDMKSIFRKFITPVNQLVGYILSEDPTYITTYKGARSLIRKVDRDDLLQALLRSYLHV